jgi:hypothetical protein
MASAFTVGLLGQILIPIPVVGALVGGFVGGLVGGAVGKKVEGDGRGDRERIDLERLALNLLTQREETGKWLFKKLISNEPQNENVNESVVILSENQRVVEVMSRWYGISKPDDDFLRNIGQNSLERGSELWLNMIGFTAISIYCGALEMSIKEKKSLNPEYDKKRIRQIREQMEPTINFLASNINLLKYWE